MTHSHSRTSLLLAALLIAATSLIAGRVLLPTHPATVGVVDLERVFNESYIWANKMAELKALEDALESNVMSAQAKVKELWDEMKNFQENSPAWVQKQGLAFEAIGNYNALKQFKELKVESGRAKVLRETYAEIQSIAKKYAQEHNIDLVMVDDSIPEMMMSDSQRTGQNIAARRFLYTTDEFNITAELVALLNLAHPLNPGVKLPEPKPKSGVANANNNAANAP